MTDKNFKKYETTYETIIKHYVIREGFIVFSVMKISMELRNTPPFPLRNLTFLKKVPKWHMYY